MIREAAQAVHAAINKSPVTPTVEALEGILAGALGAAVSGRVMTSADVCSHEERPVGASLEAIACELDQMAGMRATCNAIERAWLDAKRPQEGPLAQANETARALNRSMLERLEALAAAASLCEADACSGLFLQAAFAEHLYDASTAYEDHIDLGKFELAQSLQHAALRGLIKLGALDGRRADLVQPFCRVREPMSAMMAKVEGIHLGGSE